MNIKHASAGLAAAGLALLAGPALATGASHTVSVGGTPLTGSTTFTAATPTTGTNVLFTVRNNSGTIINLNCTRATASGTIQPGVNVATITSSTWTGCTAPGGPVTVAQVGGWNLHSSNAYTSSAIENVVGHVDDISANVQNTASPTICKFSVKGAGPSLGLASGTFSESAQSLSIAETGYTGNLSLQNVVGCGGQLQSGNPANMSATFAVTAVGGAVNVTS
jgi:hypothetical protein